MASLVFKDAKIFVAGHDFTGQMNAVAMEYAADMLDETTFGVTARIRKGGQSRVNVSASGLWDASATTAVDPVLFARVGTADLPTAIVPEGGTPGLRAFMVRAINAEYKVGAEIGNLLPFDVAFQGSGGHAPIQGWLLYNASATNNVTGTAFNIGAVGASQYVYGALHVFSGSGNFTVKVQSASDEAFTSPNDRITFTQVATGTAVSSEWATRVAGSITDQWWRIVATNPATRNFAVTVGIQ